MYTENAQKRYFVECCISATAVPEPLQPRSLYKWTAIQTRLCQNQKQFCADRRGSKQLCASDRIFLRACRRSTSVRSGRGKPNCQNVQTAERRMVVIWQLVLFQIVTLIASNRCESGRPQTRMRIKQSRRQSDGQIRDTGAYFASGKREFSRYSCITMGVVTRDYWQYRSHSRG